MGLFDSFKKQTTTDEKPFDSTALGIATNTIKGIPRALSEKVGQPLLRAYAGFGGAITKKPLVPTGQFQKELYGTDQPLTLRKSGAEQFGVKETSKFAPALGFAGVLGDLIPGGGAAKAEVKAAAKGVKAVAETSKELGGIKGLLKTFAEFHPEDQKYLSDVAGKILSGQRTNTKELELAGQTLEHYGFKVPPTKEGLAKFIDDAQLSAFSKEIDLAPKDFNPEKYVGEQLKARKEASAVPGTVVTKGKTFLQDVKSKLVDFTAPIEDILSSTLKKNKIKLAPTEDIHNQIDRVLRAPTLAGQFAKDNGIADVIKNVGNIDNLDQYLIAKHALELDSKSIKTGRDIAKDSALVKAFGPKYEEYARTISDYSRKLLDYSVDSGLISKNLADTLKERYPNYVPFQRVFNELEKSGQGGPGGVASLSKQSIVQKIEGSERAIESPIESLLAKTNDAFKQGEKNIAGKLLAGYEKLPGNPFQLKELTGGESAPHTISFFDNGVKRTFETTKDVAEAAKSLNVQQLNILGKIFALPVRIARVGITGINLPFVGANIAKDAVTAFINSDHALATSVANPVNFVKSLFSAVAHDKLYDEMVRAGGGGTTFDIARNQTEATVKGLRASRNLGTKIAYTVRHPSELLKTVENIIGRGEEFTRLQQYRGTKMASLRAGMPEKEAITAGARQARDATVNFARRGEWGSVLNSAFLYLNAGIQGTRALLRNLKDKPLQTGAKIAISAMYPVAMATTWNLSDPKRKAAYKDIAEYEKENNIIIIPPNPTKDKQGRWNVIKIPLSQEVNNLVGLVRRPIESANKLDPLAFGDFAKSLVGTVSPINPTKGSVLSSLTPQAIKPTIEAATNTNLFTGYKQVPDSLARLPLDKQVKSYTSGTVRLIANKLNISPIKAEEFIKGTFGGVGSQALNAVDNFLAATGGIPENQVGGQDILEAIGARFNKARGGEIKNKQYEKKKKSDKSLFGSFK